MRKWPLAMMFLAAATLPSAGMAQRFDAGGRPAASDRRLTAGITVPLGAGRASRGAPQFELRASRERFDAFARDRAMLHGEVVRQESRIGFTLQQRPQLTVGGQPLPAADDRLGLSTLGWVAIGVAAAAVVGGLLFIDAVNDASD